MTSDSSLQMCLGASGTYHLVIFEINIKSPKRQSHTSCPIANPFPTPRPLSWLPVVEDSQAGPVKSTLGIIFHRLPHTHSLIV